MKTLAAAAIGAMAGVALIASTPQVVEERLIGFEVYPNGVFSLQWDLDRDNHEDLRVSYMFKFVNGSPVVSKAFLYMQDLNSNQKYEKSETFRKASDKWRAYNEDGNT